MSRYEQRPLGVLDHDTGLPVLPHSPEWAVYLRWLDAGNTPDPAPREAGVDRIKRTRAAWKHALRQRYAAAIDIGVQVAGARFKLDPDDRQTLIGVLASVTAGNALPTGFGWWDRTGAFVALTSANLRNLVEKMTQRDLDARQRYMTLLAAIEASNNPTDPELANGAANPEFVDINSGWPT